MNLREANTSQLRTTDTDEPRRTLANTKLPPKADSDRKVVRHRRWIQRPGIILALLLTVRALLAMVQRGPKMRSQTLPRLPEVYRMSIMDTSVFQIRSGGPFHCTRKRKLSVSYMYGVRKISIECLLYKHIASFGIFMQVVLLSPFCN